MPHLRFQGATLAALTTALLGTAHAAVKLPNVNCGTDQGNTRCKFNSSSGNAGKTGAGLPFDLGGFVTLGSGFVDVGEGVLYVPVEFGGQGDNRGAIFRVDLATGNRTVVSGYDGEEWHGRGVEYVDDRGQKQSAYDLGRVEAVRPGPGGSLLALVDKGLQQRTEVLRVDPRTGDRTLVWASRVYNDAAREGPTSIRTLEAQRGHSSATLCKGGDERVGLKPSETFETDGQNIYLFMPNQPAGTGIGLVKVPVTGGSCTWVSQYWPDGQSAVGSGPTVNTLSPLVFASGMLGKEFVAATGPNPGGNILFGIDTQTGVRRTISSLNRSVPARSKGSGDPLGYLGRLAVGGAGVATIRAGSNDDSPTVILVDPQTGNRVTAEPKVGSLRSGRDGNVNVVATIPGTTQYIVAFGKALHVWDARTGNSYLLSQ